MRGAVEVAVSQPKLFQFALEDRQHGGELAEYQHPMSAINRLIEQFEEKIQLARGILAVEILQLEQFEVTASRSKIKLGYLALENSGKYVFCYPE